MSGLGPRNSYIHEYYLYVPSEYTYEFIYIHTHMHVSLSV